MPFKKGDKNINSKGRPLGSKNKAAHVKDQLLDLFVKRMSEVKKLNFDSFFKGMVHLLPKETKIDFKAEATKLIVELESKTNGNTSD